MLNNVINNSADFAWAPFLRNVPRDLMFDSLPPLALMHPGIFISNKENHDGIDWQLFLRSLSLELWTTLLTAAILSAVIIYFMEWVSLKTRPVSP